MATLGSRLNLTKDATSVNVSRKDTSIIQTLAEQLKEGKDELLEEDWRLPIRNVLAAPEVNGALKYLKEYIILSGELYKRLPRGVLARCVKFGEAKQQMEEIHKEICGVEGVTSLYRKLQ